MSDVRGLEDLGVIEALKAAYAPDGGDVREHNADKTTLGFGLLHYALVRNLQPDHALALGSRYGFVPACIALALRANGQGRLHFVDANYDDRTDSFRTAYGGTGYWNKPVWELFQTMDLHRWIDLFVERTDSFFRRSSTAYGYVYIDANHSYEGVQYDFQQAFEHLAPGGVVTFHDALIDAAYAEKLPDPAAFGVKRFLQERFPDAIVINRWPGLAMVQPKRAREPGNPVGELTSLRLQLAAQAEEIRALKRHLGAVDRLAARMQEAEAKLNERLAQQDAYYELIARVHSLVRESIPPQSNVLVVSKGDDQLVSLDNQHGRHFPQDETGVYAGEHPRDSEEAISRVEHLRERGAQYLVFPQTAYWWFESYPGFKQHLDRKYRLVASREETAVVYVLGEPAPAKPQP